MSAADFLRGLSLADRAVRAAAERGIAKACMRLLRDATIQMPAVPLDEGTLRGSGSVHVNGEFKKASPNAGGQPTPNTDNIPAQIGDAIVASVGFNTDYAAAQHEGFRTGPDGRIIEFHNYTHSGTGAKFLERPMAENTEQYLGIVAREIKGVL